MKATDHCLRGAPACENIVLDKNNARAKTSSIRRSLSEFTD
jgi:hypothetical protein